MRRISRVVLLVVAVGLVACGPSGRSGDGDGDSDSDADGTDIDSDGPLCIDGEHRCDASGYQVCAGGGWQLQEACPAACDLALGCVDCIPGAVTCVDGNVATCTAEGTAGGVTETCSGSLVCSMGACVDACAEAATNKSYIGCEYWAADLDNAMEVRGVQGSDNCNSTTKNVTVMACGNAAGTAESGLCDPGNACPSGFTCKSMNVCVLDAQGSPYAIVVSNPQARAVDVTVQNAAGAMFTQSVPAGQVAALFPQAAPHSLADQSIDGTGIEAKAYKVTSTLPIVAYQFNPLENVNVFSNDASLLIPRTAFDVEYYGMSWPTLDRRPTEQSYNGYLSVIAWQANTVVEITPTAAVRAGATQAAIPAGTTTTFTLNAFDVLTLQASGTGDLTGTRIRSPSGTQTFGVFGGHEAAVFGETTPPNQTAIAGPCCADHLEDMLFPTSTWGKTFAVTRSQSRGTNERDVLRIMAQKPGTTVTFNPAPSQGSCGTLGAGQSCEVKIAVDTAITASEPVQIGHYLQAAIWQDIFGSVVGEGDPSMAMVVPSEQYRTDYAVLVPSQYEKSFMSISALGAGPVTVDGLGIVMTPFAGGQYRAARHQVVPGSHKISCPDGCGVLIYGYSDAVSYMFAGGLDLKQIVIN